MLKLRELTMEQHKNAERTKFAKKLVSGKITPGEYITYLHNMRVVYSWIEITGKKLGVLEGLKNICRKTAITYDYEQMCQVAGMEINIPLCKATTEYVDYVSWITDPEKILAHIYVRHMGDLSGGQIIAKKLEGRYPINFYKFAEDTEVLKDKLREKLNNDMADEAMLAFDYAHKIFLELESLDDMESAGEDPEISGE